MSPPPSGPKASAGGIRLRRRLPWWALALPVACFVVLLTLVASPSGASAASPPHSLAPLLEFLAGIVRTGA
ncbi:hypothetical protein [Streptomyces sp. NPDC101393]|uniref:hypothetical protein n=1 Tax=Streptomyces sp. NPDC101393 TaxID=3366141 RepID=UPI003824E780